MRYEEVKKRLWKESLIVAVILLLLGGCTYYLTLVLDEEDHNSKQLETQVNTIVATMNTLRDKFSLVQKNANLYQEILKKSAYDGLNVNREFLRERFRQLNSAFYLSGNSTNMDAPQEMTGPNYKRVAASMMSSAIKSHFFALSDEDVYSLVASLERDLTGAVKFNRLAVSRKGLPTEETLASIRKSGRAELVETEMEFLWLGIKMAEEAPAKTPNGAAPAPGAP